MLELLVLELLVLEFLGNAACPAGEKLTQEFLYTNDAVVELDAVLLTVKQMNLLRLLTFSLIPRDRGSSPASKLSMSLSTNEASSIDQLPERQI